MDTDYKSAERIRKRLSVIRLAEELGSVTEACRNHDISRTQFYEFKRRYLAYGFDGLKDLPPVHKSHPQTTPRVIVETILELSLEYPTWGCARLCSRLLQMGMTVSGPTIQKILITNHLGSKRQRLLRLEMKALKEGYELNEEQTRAIEQANPCFKARHIESARPGELLGQDTIFVGHLKKIGKAYLQAVVDTYSSFAFGHLYTGKHPEHAAYVIQNKVMPQFEEWGLLVSAILTCNHRTYCGYDSHPYESCLALNDIKHLTMGDNHPEAAGFVKRFRQIIIADFLCPTKRLKQYGSIESLQEDLDIWLKQYNEELYQHGYRNLGKRPMDMIIRHLQSEAHNRDKAEGKAL